MRTATVSRHTNETKIDVSLTLNSLMKSNLNSGVSFLDHMLDQIARHGRMQLDIVCKGDTHIDDHHSVEDVGIALGCALKQALGDKKGCVRYGANYAPLDEALSRVVIDLSGRPGLYFNASFPKQKIGTFDVELVQEFFQGLVNHAMITVHIDVLKGINTHHMVESIFKAFARALYAASTLDEQIINQIPSTKGAL
ncbi:hypothetical protein AwWohl_08790 [Gammaproteobacteria bacterium]|nr:hypothetical protein AwWohl_08790 [Gammaproteobacteria bacterium]